FVGAVSVAATFFKDPAFSQEAEWRLAVIPPDNALQQQMPLQFRTVRGAVVPYRVLQLSRVTIPTTGIGRLVAGLSDCRLTDVIVGPGPDQDMAALGILQLLEEREFSDARVTKSSTPYRW
ncbi:MAG: hypothetical protein AB7T31_17875, partial [Gemmatimonadales bacterium]